MFLPTPNTFGQLRANADAMSNMAHGKTYLPGIPEKYDHRSLYDKLKNNIVYNTTGYDREIVNSVSKNIERW